MDRLLRYLILSDIHANLEALDAVLAAGDEYEQVLMLGDVVGYGADPNAVIDRLRALPLAAIIRGNHDKVAAGLVDAGDFNYIARQAVAWTAAALTDMNRTWVAALPKGPVAIDDDMEICHGTPFDEDVYVFDEDEARRALSAVQRPLCLFGHTHVPAAFRLAGRQLRFLGPTHEASFRVDLDEKAGYLVNCGAVGQPRDGDPRAAYGVVDTATRTLTIHRIEYDVAAAQAKIVRAGLPPVLAQRLALGR